MAAWRGLKSCPTIYGYEFAPQLAPRMQLNPEGWRSYIELRPVREIKKSLVKKPITETKDK